jgi:hypothetical protein
MVFGWIANSDFARWQAEINSSFIIKLRGVIQKVVGSLGLNAD